MRALCHPGLLDPGLWNHLLQTLVSGLSFLKVGPVFGCSSNAVKSSRAAQIRLSSEETMINRVMTRRGEWPRVWHHRNYSRSAPHQYGFCLHENTRHGGSGNLFPFFHSSAGWKKGIKTANDLSG